MSQRVEWRKREAAAKKKNEVERNHTKNLNAKSPLIRIRQDDTHKIFKEIKMKKRTREYKKLKENDENQHF